MIYRSLYMFNFSDFWSCPMIFNLLISNHISSIRYSIHVWLWGIYHHNHWILNIFLLILALCNILTCCITLAFCITLSIHSWYTLVYFSTRYFFFFNPNIFFTSSSALTNPHELSATWAPLLWRLNKIVPLWITI